MRNSQFGVDMKVATQKWGKIVESLGVNDDAKKMTLVEYAEMHSHAVESGMVKENVAYGNPANTAGMGAVVMPGINPTPGLTGTAGSGDLGQTMLPAALKIAAHTPGLDLVPTINVNSNRVDLLFWDWRYDDVATLEVNDERSSSFKFADKAGDLVTYLKEVMLALGVKEGRGVNDKSIYFQLSAVTGSLVEPTLTAPTGSKANWLQFKGFGRLDGMPIFRAYVQPNSASSGSGATAWGFTPALNTFPATGSILANLAGKFFPGILSATVAEVEMPVIADLEISAVSLNEDMIDDFTTARKPNAVTRDEWDFDESGKIGPRSEVKSIQIGVAHVSAGVRLSEIGDWKRMYGVDVVEKTKAQLVNLMSQKISMEIVNKVKELGLKNRAQAPAAPATMLNSLATGGITDGKIYDFSVSAIAAQLFGENSQTIARKLWAKVQQASFFVSQDGRIGGIDYIITSGTIAGILKSIETYTIMPMNSKLNAIGQIQNVGTIDGIKIYVDPYQNYDDLTVYMGRVGGKDDPGVKFLAYMLAEYIEVRDVKTVSPKLYMYSRYAVAELGWFPEKQYFAIKVEDIAGSLF